MNIKVERLANTMEQFKSMTRLIIESSERKVMKMKLVNEEK